MKNIFKLFFTSIVFASLLFTSCSNLVEDSSNEQLFTTTDVNNKTVTKSLTIEATSEEGELVFGNSSSRTILPGAIKDTTLKFYIGIKPNKGTYTYEEITFTQDAADVTGCTGTVKKTNLTLGSYDFVLFAVDSSNNTVSLVGTADETLALLKNNALLAGYASADLRYSDTIKFYLSSNTVTGAGKIDLTINSDWKLPTDYSAKIELVDYKTNTKKYPSTGTVDVLLDSDRKLKLDNWTYNNASIDSGSYNVVVTFKNSKTLAEYVFSEKLVVLPRRKSTGTITIPEIIDRAPTPPRDLIVGYSKPESSDMNYYKTEFAWTDTAYNERQFCLQIMCVDDSSATKKFISTPTNDAQWEDLAKSESGLKGEIITLVNQAKAGNSPAETQLSTYQYYIEGSLNMNNNHISLYLPLGHRYVARIRAQNDYYQTAWTYANLHSTTGKTAGCTVGDSLTFGSETVNSKVTTAQYTLTTDVFEDDVSTINQYKITYNTVGGTFEAKTAFATTGTDKPKPATTVYASQHNKDASTAEVSTTSVKILVPNAKTDTDGTNNTYVDVDGEYATYKSAKTSNTQTAMLKLTDPDGFYWKKWKVNGITGTDYEETDPWTEYTNLSLFATYDVSAPTGDAVGDVTISDVTLYELKKEYIEIAMNKSNQNILPGKYGAASGTKYYFNTLPYAEFEYGSIDDISLSIATTNLKDTNNAAFNYDEIHVKVTRVKANDTRLILNQEFKDETTAWTAKIENVDSFTSAVYYVEVTAKTKKYPLIEYSQNYTFRISETQ